MYSLHIKLIFAKLYWQIIIILIIFIYIFQAYGFGRNVVNVKAES